MKDPYTNKKHDFSLNILINFFVAIVKTPLFISMILLHRIHIFVSKFLIFPILKRYFHRLSSLVCCGILKIISGLFSVPIKKVEIKENKPKSYEYEDLSIKAGDVIICNYPSYTDLIFLQFKFTPVFIIPVDSDHVMVKTFHDLFFDTVFGRESVVEAISNEEAVEYAKNAVRAPLVLLPEKKRTNCTTLTKFNQTKLDYSKTNVFIAGLKHDECETEPNCVSGSFFAHYVLTIGNLFNSLEINILSHEDMSKIEKDDVEECRKLVAMLADIPLYDDTKSHVD